MSSPPPRSDVTDLLLAWRQGEEEALDELIALVHPELRRIASNHLRREGRAYSLQPTDLVHEAYLKLVDGMRVNFKDRGHFFAIASRVMRRILVDHARRRQAAKRQAIRVTFSEQATSDPALDIEMIALDAALKKLEESHPAAAEVIQLRFFGGLSIRETAETIEKAPVTVERAWSFGRAWLYREIEGVTGP